MTVTQILVTMFVIGGLTYGLRLSFIAFADRREPPEWAVRVLGLIPPAVLTALLAPELIYVKGTMAPAWDNERMWAALVALIFCWRRPSMIMTMIVGMAALWGFRLLF